MLSTLPTASLTLPASTDATVLLDAVEPVAGSRVLVIGHGALETVCALLRRGCTAATEMAACGTPSPEADSVESVVVPEVRTTGEAQAAIAMASRALMAGGRIVLGTAAGALRQPMAAMLSAHGFSVVRAHAVAAGTVLTAKRPMFGPLHRQKAA